MSQPAGSRTLCSLGADAGRLANLSQTRHLRKTRETQTNGLGSLLLANMVLRKATSYSQPRSSRISNELFERKFDFTAPPFKF
jgi:hypothetical protein